MSEAHSIQTKKLVVFSLEHSLDYLKFSWKAENFLYSSIKLPGTLGRQANQNYSYNKQHLSIHGLAFGFIVLRRNLLIFSDDAFL